jgi:hypothetical protein
MLSLNTDRLQASVSHPVLNLPEKCMSSLVMAEGCLFEGATESYILGAEHATRRRHLKQKRGLVIVIVEITVSIIPKHTSMLSVSIVSPRK